MGDDRLARLLAEGGPPATAAGLAGVVARRHRLARRRLGGLTGAAVALAAAMVGLVAAGDAPGPGRAAASAAGRAAAGGYRASGPRARPVLPVAAAPAAGVAPSGAPGSSAAASAAGEPAPGRPLRLLFLATDGTVSVRAYLAPAPAGPRGPASPGCRPVAALVVEAASARAVGRLVLGAPASAAGFGAAADAVLGAAEGAPFAVAAARVPAGTTSVSARFAGGPTVAATVRSGWAVAVDPSVGRAGAGVRLRATGAGGQLVASAELAGDAVRRTPSCPAAGGGGG